MRRHTAIILLAAAFTFSGCGITRQITDARALARCKYSLHSISDLNISGIDLSGGMNLLKAAMLGEALSSHGGEPLPISFNINLNVHNLGERTAAIDSVSYTVFIDGMECADGGSREPFSVDGGDTEVLPLRLTADLTLLGDSRAAEAVKRLAMNVIGRGKTPSELKIKMKPYITVGQVSIPCATVPINFTVGRDAE